MIFFCMEPWDASSLVGVCWRVFVSLVLSSATEMQLDWVEIRGRPTAE